MRKLLATALGLALLVGTTTVRAGWVKRSKRGSGPPLVGVSAPDPDNVFTIGMTVTLSFPPSVTAHVFASDDRGVTFTEITGTVGDGQGFWAPATICFVDANTGWVAGNSVVYRTVNRGGSWSQSDAGADINVLHFFDALSGIATGDGGAISRTSDGGTSWSQVNSPTAVDLRGMFWLDRDRGWIVGYDSDDSEEPKVLSNGVVLQTTDGGETWSVRGGISERGLARPFFLPDGKTGWVVAWRWLDAIRAEPSLYRTDDGGNTFADITPPLRVGTVVIHDPMPVNASSFNTIFWSDAQHGHLGGSAYVTKLTDFSTGSDTPIWRTIDYLTQDGGVTWQKTDLGTIVLDTVGDTPPHNDGLTFGGVMRNFYDGIMIGDMKTLWGYAFTCPNDGSCAPGYTCDAGACEPICDPGCPAGERCDNGACVPEEGGDGTGDDDGDANDGDGTGSKLDRFDEGCTGSGRDARAAAWAAVALLGLFAGGSGRSRRSD